MVKSTHGLWSASPGLECLLNHTCRLCELSQGPFRCPVAWSAPSLQWYPSLRNIVTVDEICRRHEVLGGCSPASVVVELDVEAVM